MKEQNTTDKLYDLLHTLGKKWSIELMQLVKKGSKSYTQLQKELGINSKLVSTKLKELMDLRILKKEGDKYDLSKLGKKVFKKIKPLTKVVVDFAAELKEEFNEGIKKNQATTKALVAKKSIITKKPAAKVVKKVTAAVKKPVAKAVTNAKKVVSKASTAVKKTVATAKISASKAVKKVAAPVKAVVSKATKPVKAAVKKVATKVAPKKATPKAAPKKTK